MNKPLSESGLGDRSACRADGRSVLTGPGKKPRRAVDKATPRPPNPVEEFHLKLGAGCPYCDFDEAEGGLLDHCRDCQREIVTLAYRLFCTEGRRIGVKRRD